MFICLEADSDMEADHSKELAAMIDNPITFTSGQMTIMDILEARSHGGKKTISLDHIDIYTESWIEQEAVYRLLFLILIKILLDNDYGYCKFVFQA